jgi:BirA family biotin operon repressor/biotin-[acetyl-CoA-carboxylase] ligase
MPGSPYADLDRPPLVPRALERALVVPGGLWRRIDIRTETDSTNADAVEAARQGVAEGLVIVAEQQRAGRGRRDRQWVSPPRAGLTLSEAVEQRAELDAALKWPNDLLVAGANGDAKCAGILAEVTGDAVVIGIGLNVTTRAGELPATTGLPATSLRLAGARITDRDPLLRTLLRSLALWYEGWREAGGDAEMCGLLGAYRKACATIGRDVTVQLPTGPALTGTVTTVDGDGQLVIRTDDGAESHVSAGDVVHVR